MLHLLVAGTVAFGITFLAIPPIIKVAEQKRLFDMPDGRKLHTRPIASLGGVGIFVGFLLACLLSIPYETHPEFQYFLASAIIIFFLGVKDDILILSATKKFVGQIAAAAIIIHFGGVQIESMHGFLGVHQLPEPLSLLFSYTSIIVIINAFNLIDGVDGLAASIGIITTGIFGVYFLKAGIPAYSLLAFSMTSCLAAFLIYNYNPAKIFMGDSGSLLLGLVNAILVIKFINVADSYAGTFPMESSVAMGFSVLIVPLFDTLRVFSIRIYRGHSPFSPDRNHLHHLLLVRGFSHSNVTVCCVLLNVFFIMLTYFGRSLGSTVLICSMLSFFFVLVGLLHYVKRTPATLVIASTFPNNEPAVNSTTKVVPLKTEVAVVAE